MTRPTVVCVAAVKNEAWIMERFLTCASLWADHIIVADQSSSDGTRDIARRFPRVELIDNPGIGWDERPRRQLLLDAARRIPGPRVIVMLDADEVLSAEVLSDPEWDEALRQPPGTPLVFGRLDLGPRPGTYLYDCEADRGDVFRLGLVDDGAGVADTLVVHGERLPAGNGRPFRLRRVRMLHYQFCDPARTTSKHRWYRCFERVRFPEKSLVAIHRTYDWMERYPLRERRVDPGCYAGYTERGIDMHAIRIEGTYWWDWEVLRLFAVHGLECFRGLDVWDVDWEELRRAGLARGEPGLPEREIVRPGSPRHELLGRLLKATARHPTRKLSDLLLRLIAA